MYFYKNIIKLSTISNNNLFLKIPLCVPCRSCFLPRGYHEFRLVQTMYPSKNAGKPRLCPSIWMELLPRVLQVKRMIYDNLFDMYICVYCTVSQFFGTKTGCFMFPKKYPMVQTNSTSGPSSNLEKKRPPRWVRPLLHIEEFWLLLHPLCLQKIRLEEAMIHRYHRYIFYSWTTANTEHSATQKVRLLQSVNYLDPLRTSPCTCHENPTQHSIRKKKEKKKPTQIITDPTLPALQEASWLLPDVVSITEKWRRSKMFYDNLMSSIYSLNDGRTQRFLSVIVLLP